MITPDMTLSGLPGKIKLRTLLKHGVSYSESANEPSAFEDTLVGSATKVTLGRHITVAKAFNITLAHATFPLGAETRQVRLKPSRKQIGKAEKFGVQVQVVATDASGNHTTTTKTIKVR